MIGPKVSVPHPRSVLKRRPAGDPGAEVAAKRAAPDVVDIDQDVCSYETISEYIHVFNEEGVDSPTSLESGYQTSPGPQDDEDSNLSWLLNFKVSSLFDPAEDRAPIQRVESCACGGYQRAGAGKPPYTYTELIEQALREQGELTVSGIYSWISAKFPYYNPSDDRWKNSVRHNLSINPHFRKGIKSRHGSGHLWTLSDEGIHPPPESWKRCRSVVATSAKSKSPVPMDEAAVAAASIMLPEEPATDPGLHRAAEEILSGVKRRVEVQYLVRDHNINEGANGGERWPPEHTIILTVPPSTSWPSTIQPNPTEFLHPVSKEELMSESGLENDCDATSSLLSDLNSELHLPDNLFSDELAFTCYSHL